MADTLPPLNEPDNGETRRSDEGVTRPTPPPVASPPTPKSTPTVRPTASVQPPQRPQRPPSTLAPRVAPPSRPVRRKADDTLYLPWWSLLLMLFAVMGVVFGIVAIFMFFGASTPPTELTPVIRVITGQPPTAINIPSPEVPTGSDVILSGGNPPSQLQLSGPTLAPILFTPTPAPIVLGSTIRVVGVGAQQLNVRDNAGVLGTVVLFRSPEETRFSVVDGPLQADGFTWWKIQNPTNATQSGWAVANYLQVVIEGQ